MRRDLIPGAVAVLLLVLSLPATAIGQASPSPASSAPLSVVATTTVLADLVAQTGGPLVTVSSLVPKGGEVHTYEPSPEDAVRIAEADLIAMNGVGLDEWLREVIETAGVGDVPVVELGEDLEGVTYLAPAEHEDEHEGEPVASGEGDEHEGETANPHLWLNVGYAQLYVDRLVEVLSAANPSRAPEFAATGAAYRERLGALDSEIRTAMEAIPVERRRVVSLHEAFPYFAAAYGFEIVGAVIENPGQEPSASDIAALIDSIRANGVSALFAEGQFPQDLVDIIAQETGVPVIRGLFSDTLGDPPADTYEGMMRFNLQQISDALG
jgi:ABC-type Zn uptake system ZnuABC Zn-binding protein ZnuA